MTLRVTGARCVVPVVNLFPIWKYGPITDFDGRVVREGWYPERFGRRTFATRREAEEWYLSQTTRRYRPKTRLPSGF